MTAKVSDGGISLRYDIIFNNGSNILVILARFDKLTGLDPTIVSGLQQSFRIVIDFTSHKHFTAIAMIPIQIHRDVEIYNVAIL